MQNRFLRVVLLVAFLLAAVILGKITGDNVGGVSFLAWLGEGIRFGFDPFTLDLAIVSVTLGFRLAVNFAQIIFLIAVTIVYVRCIARD